MKNINSLSNYGARHNSDTENSGMGMIQGSSSKDIRVLLKWDDVTKKKQKAIM
jgi:hypothetical protein